MEWLAIISIPFHIIFTKADKLKPKALEEAVENYKNRMLETWEEMPPYFITSSSNGMGREEILNYIDNLNQNLRQLNCLISKITFCEVLISLRNNRRNPAWFHSFLYHP